MYTTCIFCKKPLGSNEVVEMFPVGRRLAFDAARGRLWVVCRKCERWNLTPLEERWEAVETCEELFRATRMRTSTENIGLARHSEGLEMVRIGEPLRPEFAAWRYGDQFGRRRRRSIVLGTAVGIATIGGLALGGGVGGLIGMGGVGSIGTAINQWRQLGPSARFRPDDGRLLWMNQLGIVRARLAPPAGEADFGVEAKARGFLRGREERFVGEDAVRVLDAILPRINAKGGSGKTIRSAVSRIESAGRPERFVKRLAHRQRSPNSPAGVQMSTLAEPTRLALEMALNEERERRALEGELWLLERRWKEAEEIAAISDNLLIPASADELHNRHGERS
ncbi:MAG: hypothetical protein F4X60_14400 [Gemmatimonadetes bacterium]|nr:hypothetical protein [Gemmatimonadota bacterium]MYB99729.1 hypothetical protein [Gemmatimonadota bacterium]